MSGQERTDSVCLCPVDMVAVAVPPAQGQLLLCVLGTGDMARTLGQRLMHAGYRVVYGSRRPHSCGPLPQGAQVLGHAAAVQSASVVFVCVHRDHYDFLHTLAPQLKGKVLVDVSNNLRKGLYPEANAVYLQRLVPGASVVKAFNTLSAWALQNGPSDANRQVFLCGDSAEAKQTVAELSSRLGLGVVDRGSLAASGELEDFPLQLFPLWRLPLGLAAGLAAFFYLYVLTIDVINSATTAKKPEDRYPDRSFRIMVSLANKVFPIVSLIMLSLCFLPGLLASMLQLYRGTKYRCFPDWLGRWMLCRKQIGLLALALAFLHVLYTLIIPQRHYVRDKLIQKAVSQIRNNKTEAFDTTEAWQTDSYFSVGILGFGLYVVLGITSLPSVSNALSWREFSFLQSKLGSVTLFLCTLHTYLYGWDKFRLKKSYKWGWVPPAHMLCLVVPTVVLLGKLLLLLPCVHRSLARIRQGWERSDAAGAERGEEDRGVTRGRGESGTELLGPREVEGP